MGNIILGNKKIYITIYYLQMYKSVVRVTLTSVVLGLSLPMNNVWLGFPFTSLLGEYSECIARTIARSWGSVSVPSSKGMQVSSSNFIYFLNYLLLILITNSNNLGHFSVVFSVKNIDPKILGIVVNTISLINHKL